MTPENYVEQAQAYLGYVRAGQDGARWFWSKFFTIQQQGAILDAIEELAGDGPELDRAMGHVLAAERMRPDDGEER